MSYQSELRKEKLALATFTRSPEWPRVRRAFLKEHPNCEVCGIRQKLEAHHIIPYHLKPELELDATNLIALCDGGSNHHLFVGHLMSWKSFNRNVTVDAAIWRDRIRFRPKPWELTEKNEED